MFNRIFALLIVAAVLISTISPAAAAQPSGKKGPLNGSRYEVSVLIVEKGEDLFSRFGHIALMVTDRHQKTNKVYNFGTFDFLEGDILYQYARGFLNYWLSVASFAEMRWYYKMQDRTLWKRTLNLTGEQAEDIARRLEINALPQNRTYAYRHYVDNCCTRIRDLLDDELGGAISRERKDKHTGRTFRDWTRRALEGLPVFQSVILFSLGPAIDHPLTRYEEEFLPEVFGEDLDATTIGPDARPLVLSKVAVVKRKGPEFGSVVPTFDKVAITVIFALFLLGLGAPILLGKKRPGLAIRLAGMGLLVWGLFCGLGGLLLLLFWTITTHWDTHYNENLLVMPFAHLWLVGPGLKLLFKKRLGEKTARMIGWYLLGTLGLVVLDMTLKMGPFIQGNWGVIGLALVGNIAAFFALRRVGIISSLKAKS